MRFFALVAAPAAFWALAIWAPAPAGAQAGFGALYVTSLPSGADVWVDGRYIGRTPVYLDGLREGKHAMTITKTGWKVEEVDQQVASGVTTMASVQLDPLQPLHARGALVLQGAARGARVSIDGRGWEPLRPRYDLWAGSHRLKVSEASRRFERIVTIYPGETTHVLLRPPLEEAHAAIVAPAADYLPASAVRIGTAGRLQLHYGGHAVRGRIGDARFVVDGKTIVYDAPAGMVRGKLFLPLDLILAITGGKTR